MEGFGVVEIGVESGSGRVVVVFEVWLECALACR
jgi:hypothetical protein